MSVNLNKNQSKKSIAVISALAALVVIVSVTIFYASRSQPVATTEAPTQQESVSRFSFSGAEGWRKGPSNATSMALFSMAAEDGTSPCFASAEYYPGTVDVEFELSKSRAELTSGGNTMTDLGVKSLSLQTADGLKNYELHQYNIESASTSEKLMGGHSIGYVQLTDGYVKIYANCNTSDLLPGAIPALAAYRFN